MSTLETCTTDLYDHVAVTEVISPAAVLSEEPGHVVITALGAVDVRHNGVWQMSTGTWTRYDRPWASATDPGDALPVGAVHATYGVPTRYDITLYKVSVTSHGAGLGWTVDALCDEALRPASLTLDTIPRAALKEAPRPFRF